MKSPLEEHEQLKKWKEENYDRNKNQWLSSVLMVCSELRGRAAFYDLAGLSAARPAKLQGFGVIQPTL